MAAAWSQLLPTSSSTTSITIIADAPWSRALSLFSSGLERGLSVWSHRSWLWEPGAGGPRGPGAGGSPAGVEWGVGASVNQTGGAGGLPPPANERPVWIPCSRYQRAASCSAWARGTPGGVHGGWGLWLLWEGMVAGGAEIGVLSTVFPKGAHSSGGTQVIWLKPCKKFFFFFF